MDICLSNYSLLLTMVSLFSKCQVNHLLRYDIDPAEVFYHENENIFEYIFSHHSHITPQQAAATLRRILNGGYDPFTPWHASGKYLNLAMVCLCIGLRVVYVYVVLCVLVMCIWLCSVFVGGCENALSYCYKTL